MKIFLILTAGLLTALTPICLLFAQESEHESGAHLVLDGSLIHLETTLEDHGNLNVRFYGFGPVADEFRREIIEDSRTLNQLITGTMPTQHRRSLGVTVDRKILVNYVDGKGILMFYNVGIPVAQQADILSPPQESESSENPWDKARNEIRNRPLGYIKTRTVFTTYPQFLKEGLGARIDELKTSLTEALAYAGNFRNLESSDTITIYVFGPVVSGQRSILAARVSMSNAKSVGRLPIDKIQITQYFESTSSSGVSGDLYQSQGVRGR